MLGLDQRLHPDCRNDNLSMARMSNISVSGNVQTLFAPWKFFYLINMHAFIILCIRNMCLYREVELQPKFGLS